MGFGKCMTLVILCFVWLCCILKLNFVDAIDTITPSQYIKDPEGIVSANNLFKLGFFNPPNSTYRYVGIWYNNISDETVTWVANRNKPLADSSGTLRISDDGNLVVLNGQDEILWSSNVSKAVQNSSAQLTDYGNLVLQDDDNNNSLWESFQQPSNTLLPKMRLTCNNETGAKVVLTSWTSPLDPSVGNFSAGINLSSIPEFVVWKGSSIYLRSGPWNRQIFIGIPQMNSVFSDGMNLVQEDDGTYVLTYNIVDNSQRSNFLLNYDGQLGEKDWNSSKEDWIDYITFPSSECDVYGKCGAFGSCNASDAPICSCLDGFEPKTQEEWNNGNWTSGCIRKKLLQCDRVRNGNSSDTGEADGFLKLEMVKVPDSYMSSVSNEQECRDNCLSNCSCIAYGYYTGIGCLSWNQELIDIQRFSNGGVDLYVRLEYSELLTLQTNASDSGNGEATRKYFKLILPIPLVIGVFVFVICSCIVWWKMAKYRDRRKRKSRIMQNSNLQGPYTRFYDGNDPGDEIDQLKFQELPIFDLQKLRNATDDFNVTNKLGQGGFGPVYRGTLPNGPEIAVKRLSKASGQGLDELMNEVLVISKLQHRNLVRILGCCIENEEKMLVYEYMPNKSLDVFIFDPIKQSILDWKKRFNIIQGICRGLVYLHRDSRPRIIHRDLKASNILLDKELNAKISDFGMARIFGGNEDEANTRKVVGTYGYMSPEYAIQGLFSEKSDIFSFGVLLLEIVSGRKNTSFYENEEALSLIGYVWKLWNEGNLSVIIEPTILVSCFKEEIFRCILIGLLCVQEFGRDRPDASTVLSMLNSEITDLPTPNKPAFTERQIDMYRMNIQEDQKKNFSVDNATITILEGR